MFIKNTKKTARARKVALAVSLYRGVLFKGYRLLKKCRAEIYTVPVTVSTVTPGVVVTAPVVGSWV